MKAIVGATLVMRDHLVPEAVLLIEDGRIKGFGEMRSTPVPDGCERIDAQGLFLGPGLIDDDRAACSVFRHGSGGVA